MPAYQWRCHVCYAANDSGTEICSTCANHALLTTTEINERIAERQGKGTVIVRTPIRQYRTFMTWFFILLYVFGGIQGFWVAAFGFGEIANYNPFFSHYASTFDWVDRLLWFVYGGLSIGIGVLLYQLKKAAIVTAWIYILGSSLVLLAELAFRDAKRAMIVDLGAWAILLGYGFWVITLWYLYWLKRQGRLRA